MEEALTTKQKKSRMFFYCHKINPTTTLKTKPLILLQCNTQEEKLVVNKDGCSISVMVLLIFHKVCMQSPPPRHRSTNRYK